MHVIYRPLSYAAVLALAFFLFATVNVTAQNQSDCVIPASGPWPACATGGGSHTPAPTNNAACVIPESGPWPACATGGGGAAVPSAPATTDCVIPSSGPWPPCATGGASNPVPASSNGDCQIPASGPWPACATGGGSSDDNSSNDNSSSPEPKPSLPTAVPTETAPEAPAAETTPTAEPTPMPTPEPTAIPNNGEFGISNVRFSERTSREVVLRFDYVNMPREYLPYFVAIDPKNCISCRDATLTGDYFIRGIGAAGLENWDQSQVSDWANPFAGLQFDVDVNGSIKIVISIDNSYCGGNVWYTESLLIGMADHRVVWDNSWNRRPTTLDYAIEVPFAHTWCDD